MRQLLYSALAICGVSSGVTLLEARSTKTEIALTCRVASGVPVSIAIDLAGRTVRFEKGPRLPIHKIFYKPSGDLELHAARHGYELMATLGSAPTVAMREHGGDFRVMPCDGAAIADVGSS